MSCLWLLRRLSHRIQKGINCGPVGRVSAAVEEPYFALGIDNHVAAQLPGVSLREPGPLAT